MPAVHPTLELEAEMLPPKRRLWEFQGFIVCRILGLSFDGEELHHICHKLQISDGQQSLTEPEMHGKLVTTCKEPNQTSSKYVDKLLSQRFELYRRRVERLNQEDICGIIERGEVFEDVPLEALIWFAVRNQHEKIEEIETRVFNAVHIREHHALRFYDALSRVLPDGKVESVMEELKEAQESSEEFHKRYQRSKYKKEQLRSEIEALKKDNSQLVLTLAEQRRLNEKLRKDLEKLGGEEALEQVEALKKEVELLTQELKTLSEELLKQELYGVPIKLSESLSYPKDTIPDRILLPGKLAEKPDVVLSLNGTKVAFVGGVDSLVPYYREVVECLGGIFVDHCAVCSQGKGQIERLVGKADVVFCPVDVNSHTACRCAKKVCKCRNKPCYFLRSSSLSTFRKGLVNLVWNKDGVEG